MALPAAVHMALDEVLLERLIAGARGPTLRFWDWEEPTLILGSHQVLANEVDQAEAQRSGFAVTRRMSGGGTMIAEPGRTITYSMYLPESIVAGLGFVDSFAFLDAWTVACLTELGVPASYRPINDIVSPGGKIGGAAQARRRGFVLHHTTIAYAMEPSLVRRLIRLGRRAVSPRGVRSAVKEVSPLDRWLSLDREDAVAALACCFAERCPSRPGTLSGAELDEARELARTKYATPEWIDRLP